MAILALSNLNGIEKGYFTWKSIMALEMCEILNKFLLFSVENQTIQREIIEYLGDFDGHLLFCKCCESLSAFHTCF